MAEIQPAVKKETVHVAGITLAVKLHEQNEKLIEVLEEVLS